MKRGSAGAEGSSYRYHEFNQGQGSPAASDSALIRTREYRQFDEYFRGSLQMKDQGLLASALRMRKQGTETVRQIPALYCIGKHNEMILEYNHIGHGIEARKSALESLSHEEEFKQAAMVFFPMFRSNYYLESIDYMTCCSTSYEEAEYYFAKLKEEFPTDASRARYDEFKQKQREWGRWYTMHRAISMYFYSRATPQMDKGKYAAGLSVMDVILANAQQPGYNLDYEEYSDVIDDMCALAMKLFMQKAERWSPGYSTGKEAEELGCILVKPIAYLTDFYPDCLSKDRELFYKHYKSFALVPWIDKVRGWEELKALMA